MGRVVGYVRVSSDRQTVKNQEHAIYEYCHDKGLTLDETIKISISSRKTPKQRRIDELLEKLQEGDTLIVSELSRLARSVGQIAIIIDTLLNNQVRVICIKEDMDLNGERDIQAKTMITIISLFAELERDLISVRTKEGLARARAEGKLLGRPKGTLGKSQLDGKEEEIKRYLGRGVNKTNIARIFQVGWTTMDHFIRTRKLA